MLQMLRHQADIPCAAVQEGLRLLKVMDALEGLDSLAGKGQAIGYHWAIHTDMFWL